MRWLSVIFLLILALAAGRAVDAQPAPPAQCVSTAVAGGTSDAITVPRLPCGATTTLLILTTGASPNTTPTPTLQQSGFPAFPIRNFDGGTLGIGQITAVSKLLLTFNGSFWYLLNGAAAISTNPLFVGGIDLCGAFASCSGDTTTLASTATVGATNVTLTQNNNFASNCVAGLLPCGIVIGGGGAPFTIGPADSFAVASYCTPVSKTATAVAGSPILTGVTAMEGIAVGYNITGANIPANTKVTDFNIQNGVIRISNNATGSGATTVTYVDPCQTTYFYKIATFDDNGGIGKPSNGVSTGTGPNNFNPAWNINCLTWNAPLDGSNPSGYVLWKSIDGGATYQFFQIATVEGTTASGACATLTPNDAVRDGGQPTTSRPWWIPNDPNTIGTSGQPDWLATTVAAGGGTVNITLAAPLQSTILFGDANPVIGYVIHDDTDGYLAWITALNQAGGAQGNVHGPSIIRIRTGGVITAGNTSIVGQTGAIFRPFGAIVGPTMGCTSGGVLSFFGSCASSSLFVPTQNLAEGSTCLIASGGIENQSGTYILARQFGPGGLSQAVEYQHMSPIASGSCPDGGAALSDAAGVTFTNATRTETGTITGTIKATDTIQVSLTGDLTCSYTYTVTAGDEAGTTSNLAQNWALGWNTSGACPGIVATETNNIVQFQAPSYYSTLNWAQSVTHGGGGTEAIVLAQGTGFAIDTFSTILGSAAASNITINGTDATGKRNGPALVGITAVGTAFLRLGNITLSQFTNNGTATFFVNNYRAIYDNFMINNGSGGTPNLASYSDFFLVGDTRSIVDGIESLNPLSFGVQFQSVSGILVSNVSTAGAAYGRGLKIAGAVASQFTNMKSTDAVHDDMIVCCGTYQNMFFNITTAHARGVNQDGLSLFGAWDRWNIFHGYKGTGSRYDLTTNRSDDDNTFTGVYTGNGGSFASISVDNSNLFYDVNGCPAARQEVSGTPSIVCQVSSGTWVPAIGGSSTAGSATYTTQQGHWQKDWHYLTAQFNILTSSALGGGAAGNLVVNGLPFPMLSGAVNGTCDFSLWSNITFSGAGYTALGGLVLSGNTIAELIENGQGGSAQVLPVASAGNPVNLIGTCTYRLW